ncbi:MAG TPA: HAD-IC family P-type ATPase, partial [Planctomycetota bacterium]|nr:HAD-IC family P-type ATPase [Planctomycetota bacterium]
DDGACIGLLAIADTIKPSARIAVDALRRQGCEIIMMTGDSEATAVAVASKLQITDVYARVKPEHKAIEVDRWRLEGWVVAMAGDGVNDAPALAAANVGIAMSTGSDVAIESADITLVGGDLHAIVRARDLSRRTLRNIKQNISFAFFFHALAIPVAAGFFYVGLGLRLTPGLLATAMALGTLAVIGNSLRLRWWNAVVAG